MNVKIPGLKYNKTINEQLDVFESHLNRYGALLLENKQLKQQLEQKNRIIANAIYYLENLTNFHVVSEIKSEKILLYASMENFVHELLNILNEGSDE